ncbi:hypothetical protein DFH29DRAFT_997979 [Suillus ampliporus]|nr:hypothetical protein DFH29DRAFT_997979 [Suillus ampliporus]
MSITIPTGSYVIMNATTHTYLNVCGYQAVPGDVVNSVGNNQGNDIVRLLHALHLALQSYGTGAFLSFDQSNISDTPAGSVVTSNSIYPWSLQQNTTVPYAWNIVDKYTGKALTVQNNSVTNGAQVLEDNNINHASRAWIFIGRES